MADFRLPISDTSTHKSVNPNPLLLKTTLNDTVSYDGSSTTTVNLAGLIVDKATSLVDTATFNVNLSGATATPYDGAQTSVNVSISKTLNVNHGGTGLSTIAADSLLLGKDTTTLKLLAKSTTKGQVLGIDSNSAINYQSLTLNQQSNTGDGDIITLKVGNTAASSIQLATANASQSGVVTTVEQKFAGAKTFESVHSPLFCVEDSSNAHKVQLQYNSITKALDFNFV